MRGGHRSGLLRVVNEVALGKVRRFAADDLDRVLVGAHGAVRAEAVEQRAHRLRVFGREGRIVTQAGVRDVVVNANREVVLRLRLGHLVEDALDHGGSKFLRREPIAAADDCRHGVRQAGGVFTQYGEDVLIERLAQCAGFLAAVENGNRLHRRGQRGQEGLRVKRPEQANLDHADLLALLDHQVRSLFGRFGAGAHEDDHALRIGRAIVIEEVIGAAGLGGKAIHHRLHNRRNRGVEGRTGLAGLEEDVGILRRAADDWPIRAEGVFAVFENVLVVQQGADGLVANGQNLAHFMRGAEAVEEVNERDAGLQRGDLRHQRQIVNLLDGVRAEHRPARRAAGHHVGVVAKDRQRVGGQRAGRHVHGRRGQFTGNLEHIGNHQQ